MDGLVLVILSCALSSKVGDKIYIPVDRMAIKDCCDAFGNQNVFYASNNCTSLKVVSTINSIESLKNMKPPLNRTDKLAVCASKSKGPNSAGWPDLNDFTCCSELPRGSQDNVVELLLENLSHDQITNDEILLKFCNNDSQLASHVDVSDWDQDQSTELSQRDSIAIRPASPALDVPTVEILLVADHTMSMHLEREEVAIYLDTVTKGVEKIYRDKSIGFGIGLIFNILILDPSDQTGVFIDSDALESLWIFCRWKTLYEKKSDVFSDLAILVTRTNLCRSRNGTSEVCQTLGLTHLGCACSPNSNCALVQDTGLMLAFTIAHEIGHSLGLKHDQAKDGETVMQPSLAPGFQNLKWSTESRSSFQHLQREPHYSCLWQLNNSRNAEKVDVKSNYRDGVLRNLPGIRYSLESQCRLALGQNQDEMGIVCEEVSNCSKLFCKTDNGCIFQGKPAQGTDCGHRKWCFDGECVPMDPEAGHQRPGEWSLWSEWTPCSRSCGVGVRQATRECNSPPPSKGGIFCPGPTVRFKLCEASSTCRKEPESYRDWQCKIRIKSQTARSIKDERNPCAILCRDGSGSDQEVIQAEDGTPCYEKQTVCVQGKCQKYGCNLEFGSDLVLDRCGVCGGTGDTCLDFNHTTIIEDEPGLENKYNEVFTIPSEARKLKVTHWTTRRENVVALLGRRSMDIALNWNYTLMQPGHYQFGQNEMITYSRHSWEEWHREDIEISHIIEPVSVFLLYNGGFSNVSFHHTLSANRTKYNAPESLERENASLYINSWQMGDLTPCSVSCGEGHQLFLPICKNAEGERVGDHLCPTDSKPETLKVRCSLLSCSPVWWTGPWQPCVATCQGVRRRTVLCVSVNMTALPDPRCSAEPKPIFFEPCNQTVECVENMGTNFGEETSSISWNGRMPAPQVKASFTQEPGKLADNTLGSWLIGEWSKCSAICGFGIATRRIWCNGTKCQEDEKPTMIKTCWHRQCQEWQIDKWSTCSVTCGIGFKARLVWCEGICQPFSRPTELMACSPGPCATWWTGPWTPCSKTCGSGNKRRSVECRNGSIKIQESNCNSGSKPEEIASCMTKTCSTTVNNDNGIDENMTVGTNKCQDTLRTEFCKRLRRLCGQEMNFTLKCCQTCYDLFRRRFLDPI